MSRGQRIAYLLLGFVLGIGMSFGALIGLVNYAPNYLLDWQSVLTGTSLTVNPSPGTQTVLEQSMVKSTIQDILTSEQGKAVVNELIRDQAPIILKQIFEESMDSTEFRLALRESLDSFLKTPEGTELIRRIANEIIAK